MNGIYFSNIWRENETWDFYWCEFSYSNVANEMQWRLLNRMDSCECVLDKLIIQFRNIHNDLILSHLHTESTIQARKINTDWKVMTCLKLDLINPLFRFSTCINNILCNSNNWHFVSYTYHGVLDAVCWMHFALLVTYAI